MRAYWDRQVAKGQPPSGADLARFGGVSPATGRRRRELWERELPGELLSATDSEDQDQLVNDPTDTDQPDSPEGAAR